MQIPSIKLNTGYLIPQIALGTWCLSSQKSIDIALEAAFNSGYRHLDSAVMYGNEHFIGNALKKLKINRKDIYLTTKILPDDMTYDATMESVKQSLKHFQTDYLDLVLIHWPGGNIKNRIDSWKALEKCQENKEIRSIGVSNFTARHIKSIFDNCKIKPSVNQIEIHPLYYEDDTIEFCKKEGIAIEAYSPFAVYSPKLMENPFILELSKKYNKKVSQIILRWGIQCGFIVLPRSSKPLHIQENINIFDFELMPTEIEKIRGLNEMYKTDWDPKNLP